MNKFKSEETRLRWVQSLKNASKAKTEERIAREKEYYKNPKLCRECNLAISYKTRKNIFCSSSCSGIYNNRKRVKKQRYCGNCGNILKKNARNYCSLKCLYDYKRNEKIEKWKKEEWNGSKENGEISSIIRNYLLKEANYTCEQCDWDKINPKSGLPTVTIHHKDGSYKNNRPENLQVLCPGCHSLTDTYGSNNRGNGREYRYK